MKSKKYSARYVLGVALSSLVFALPAQAAVEEQSYYASKSQADLDYLAAMQNSYAMSGQLRSRMNNVMDAQNAYRNALASDNSMHISATNNALHDAEGNLTATLSHISGVAPAEIEAMHDNGLSWQQLGTEIGLQTIGHTQLVSSVQHQPTSNVNREEGKRKGVASMQMSSRRTAAVSPSTSNGGSDSDRSSARGWGEGEKRGIQLAANDVVQRPEYSSQTDVQPTSTTRSRNNSSMTSSSQQGSMMSGSMDGTGSMATSEDMNTQHESQRQGANADTMGAGMSSATMGSNGSSSGRGSETGSGSMGGNGSRISSEDMNAQHESQIQGANADVMGTGASSATMGSHGTSFGSGTGTSSGSMGDSGSMANGTMSFENSGRLSPVAGAGMNSLDMGSNQSQFMADSDTASQYGGMHGVTGAEMDAATSRNMMDGGVSGHGTNANSGMDHQSGSMMTGATGMDNGMPSGHASRGGSDSSGMGGSGGGMGSSDSGMGGTGSGGSAGGMGGSGGSSAGGMGGSGGGMGGSGGGMGGSGGSGGSGGGSGGGGGGGMM